MGTPLEPTPTAPERSTRPADFASIAEALDFAAVQPTGINLYSLRGELVEVLPYARLKEDSAALAALFLSRGLEPGDRVALAAESDGGFLRAFFACQYAGLVPAPVPLPAPFGGKEAYVAHLGRMLASSSARAALAPAALAEWFADAAEGLQLEVAGSWDSLLTEA
ncbi:MAG: AMP-binding protein, partial [Caulobacteraceae bacterium]